MLRSPQYLAGRSCVLFLCCRGGLVQQHSAARQLGVGQLVFVNQKFPCHVQLRCTGILVSAEGGLT